MRILIRKTAGLPRSLARLARRRLEFALGRFGTHVRSLTVRMTEANPLLPTSSPYPNETML